MQQLKKIVIIGPESTGKSTLCALLAQHYDSLWCPEFAREFLLIHGTDYTYNDLLTIAKGQIALVNQYIANAIEKWKINPKKNLHPLLFEDTDMYVMKVWCEFVFGKCHQYILDNLANNNCDLYLLCNIDLPWVKDELREYPDLEIRKKLYDIYKQILLSQNIPWADISGGYEQRLQTAIKAVNHFLLT